MKKITLTILVSILLIGIVTAGIGIDALDKTRDLDKAQIDMLLSKTDAKVIEPDVTITCSDEFCLWNAKQEGIINSYNNKFSRSYCSETDEVTGDCITTSYYTNVEIEELVADAVSLRLSKYADAEIGREDYEDWGTGVVTIVEKK